MQIQLLYNLPFITITAEYNGNSIQIPSVLIDTGSASTLLSIDILSKIGIKPEPDDIIQRIRGVGGTEVVFKRKFQSIKFDTLIANSFDIEIGAMDYGFEINGILGMDFLLSTGAIIDLAKLQIVKVDSCQNSDLA
jgi:predicted aspartyl protease